MNRNQSIITDYRYIEQQNAIKTACKELGLIYFKPNYHASINDNNTIIVYRSESDSINNNQLCHFENTDINGNFDLNFLNRGKIDLRGLNGINKIKQYLMEV